jgi:outer membrane immunogenic protein
MREIAVGFAATLLMATSAFATTPKKKPPPPPPVLVFSWTGFYVGGNVGYGWGDARTSLNGTGGGTTSCPAGACVGTPNPIFPFGFDVVDANTTWPNGAIGGFQAGYNYQMTPKWVAGLEADFQAAGQRKGGNFAEPFSSAACTSFLTNDGTCDEIGSIHGTLVTLNHAALEWVGTVRGRLGYLITDRILIYGTGGFAYGRAEISGTTASAVLTSPGNGTFAYGPGAAAFSRSQTLAGFVVGSGIEGKWLASNWSWKVEYLYIDLGSLDATVPFATGLAAAPYTNYSTPVSGTITMQTHFTDNILRVGLNYQFH